MELFSRAAQIGVSCVKQRQLASERLICRTQAVSQHSWLPACLDRGIQLLCVAGALVFAETWIIVNGCKSEGFLGRIVNEFKAT